MSTASPIKITVLLADDHPITRAGICATLSQFSDMEIIGEAQNGIDAQYMVIALRPRIILLDLRMPNLPPAEFVKWVRENYPETITLVLTFATHSVSFLAGMMEAGAVGYLSKTTPPEQLVDAIRCAACGGIVFDKEQFLRVYQWQKEVGEKIKRLTCQELQVIKLLMAGKNNQAIADALNIAVKTTTFHLTSIYSKLQVKSRHEAALWAMENLLDNLDIYPYLDQGIFPG